MKKHALNKWLLTGALVVLALSCQSRKSSTPSTYSNPVEPSVAVPPEEPVCQPMPGSEDCEYEEGDEEAMIHVIEIDDLEEGSSESNVSTEEAPPANFQSPVEAEREAPAQSVPADSPVKAVTELPVKPVQMETPVEVVREAPASPSRMEVLETEMTEKARSEVPATVETPASTDAVTAVPDENSESLSSSTEESVSETAVSN